jgi:RNA polymerase sigma-70 factor (ECF subfamily)
MDIPEIRMDTDAHHEPIDEARFVAEVYRVASKCARRLARAGDAEDIAQDVVLKCLLRLRNNRWRMDRSPNALVSSITRRTCKNRKRNDERRESRDAQYLAERTAVAPAWMNPAQANDEEKDCESYERALSELPAGCRSTFLLVREHGMTYREVAVREGISLRTIAKRVARAEAFLADRLMCTPRWRSMPPSMQNRSRVREHTTEL